VADPITSRLWGWLAGTHTPWPTGTQPNPGAIPSDPAAAQNDAFPPPLTPALTARAFYGASPQDPYNDGQWSPVIAPVGTNPEADQLRLDSYAQPYTGPLDLDDHGRETDEMRRQYREFHRSEPAIRSAIDGKAAAVAALDVTVSPADKDSPDDSAAAEWVDRCGRRHGWDRIILSFLRPGLVDGWAIAEKTLKIEPTPTKWRRYGPQFADIKHIRNVDTDRYYLRLDGYRNVLGVVSTVRGMRTYDPGKVILFSHSDMFSNPFGQSDLRAAHRSACLISDAYKLWSVALKNYSYPYVHGKVADETRVALLQKAIAVLRGSGNLVTPKGDEVALLNLASATSFDAFEKKVRILREDIFLCIRGAYTPFMQSNSGSGEARGSAAVSADAGSNPIEYVLALAVGRVLSEQLVPDLVVPNFPPGTGIPIVSLGGTNWQELKSRLDVLDGARNRLKLRISAESAYKTLQITPPRDQDDDLGLDTDQPQPGQPGAVDATGQPIGQATGQTDTTGLDSGQSAPAVPPADEPPAVDAAGAKVIAEATPEEIAAAVAQLMTEEAFE